MNISFTSLINPLNFKNINYLLLNTTKPNKIYFKQSYILITWFYLTSSNIFKKNFNMVSLPLKKKKITLLKSPMAQKNWSKEQFVYKYFNFFLKIKFNYYKNIKFKDFFFFFFF